MFHLSTLIYFYYFLFFFLWKEIFWASPGMSSGPDLWINYVLLRDTAETHWRWCWQLLEKVSGNPAAGLVNVGWALHPWLHLCDVCVSWALDHESIPGGGHLMWSSNQRSSVGCGIALGAGITLPSAVGITLESWRRKEANAAPGFCSNLPF